MEATDTATLIKQWAERHYDTSHAAQTVSEGCWDDSELAEYATLADFIETANAIDENAAIIASFHHNES